MTVRATLMLASAAALLTLAACGASEEKQLAALDNQIAGNDLDPALTNALEDQIMVDPELSGQSNANAVRPPETPTRAAYPAENGGAAGRALADVRGQMAAQGGSPCAAEFDRDARWAQRLPAAFAVYPGGIVTEAAGNDAGDCRVRVVTFTSKAAPRDLLGWYRARAEQAGYSAEYQRREGDHVLAGTAGDHAYYLVVTPRGGHSEIALIANNGR